MRAWFRQQSLPMRWTVLLLLPACVSAWLVQGKALGELLLIAVLLGVRCWMLRRLGKENIDVDEV